MGQIIYALWGFVLGLDMGIADGDWGTMTFGLYDDGEDMPSVLLGTAASKASRVPGLTLAAILPFIRPVAPILRPISLQSVLFIPLAWGT